MGTVARRLQDRFVKDAEIVLYLCNSGSDPELLQVIANTFHVVARGFTEQIWVCPEWYKTPGPPNIAPWDSLATPTSASTRKGVLRT